jgi:dihydroflavonol-4-reductase
MSQTVLVTGATGLAGANICKLLIERGDAVRALAREGADVGPLVELGVDVVAGDVTDPDAVLRAAKGSDSVIHCAALLGGASQNMADFEAVNIGGTRNVLDAAEALDLGRVVAVSTGTFFDTTGGVDREDAPVMKNPSQDPYTVTKMAAIYGPSPVESNALGRTSFNRVLLSAARGRIERYLTFPVSWVFAEDIARGCILALDKGVAGERYMLDGRPEDVVSTADACNRVCRLAGLDHEVIDVPPSDDPELVEVFGPTLIAIAKKAQRQSPGRKRLEDSKTYERLGYSPISLDEGLAVTLDWFKAIGRVNAI